MNLDDRLQRILEARRGKGELRSLHLPGGAVDLTSNDYLGLARSAWIRSRTGETLRFERQRGSTGSRLLSGNSRAHERLEQRLAHFHGGAAALLMNSGYDANIGVIGALCRPGDVILYDEAVHASMHQGVKLSGAEAHAFPHNDMEQLGEMLSAYSEKQVFVLVETVYSMDGDHAPIDALCALRDRYGCALIADEAHALGVFGKQGRGRCDATGQGAHFTARIYTFGKALGTHGAVVIGSQVLKEYLVNFCKPLIFSTAPDPAFLASVEHSYDFIEKFDYQQKKLIQLIKEFKCVFSDMEHVRMDGEGPVFGLLISPPERVRAVAGQLQDSGFYLRPIVYPTVPRGKERIRISLHSYNTREELERLRAILESITT